MLFTTTERYALRCMILMAGRPQGALTTLEDLSTQQGISKQYLANIMCHLTASGLVHTYRGLHGGYALARPAGRITMADVWDATRSADAPINCVINNAECPNIAICPIRALFEHAFGKLHAYLRKWTVQKLARELTRLHMPMTCGPTRTAAVDSPDRSKRQNVRTGHHHRTGRLSGTGSTHRPGSSRRNPSP